METCDLLTAPPAADRTWTMLRAVGDLLGLDRCWLFQRAYHFSLDGHPGWTIAVTPESAGRFRLEACHWSRSRATLWTLADDDARLAGAVLELRAQIEGAPTGV